MSLPGRPWSLLDCDDVEALCRRVIRQAGGLDLPWHLQDDALVYLIETAWELSLEYDPARNPGHLHRSGGFTGWAAYILRRRFVDWRRTQQGRTRWKLADGKVYERPRPKLESLDQLLQGPLIGGSKTGTPGEGDRINPRLARALAARSGDPTDDRDPALGRLLGGRNRQRARDLETLGLEPPRRAA